MKRDGNLQSLWQTETDFIEQNNSDAVATIVDVVIVGGGITGLTTALLLQQRGQQCIIAEAHTIGFGTTLGTSAHLNNFFDTTYSDVSSNFGQENAKLLYQAAKGAISLIKKNIADLNIDCSYSEQTAFLFSRDEEQDKALDQVVTGGQETGLPVAYSNDSVFPIPYNKIATIQGQAQFNPAPYIKGLASAFEAAGGIILQDCRVTEITGDAQVDIETSRGMLKAKNIVYATHIPPGVNLLHFRCAPYRSYVIAARLKGNNYPDGLGYDLQDPYHYYRTQEVQGKKYLVAGGEDHKTGHEENTTACFNRLESHVRSFFEVEEISFRWSSQYFEPADGLAYIGNLPGAGNNVYVATGFGGNGMIYGTIAGSVLADLITGEANEYEKLFAPGRIKPIAGFENFVKEGADVVKKFFTGKLSAASIKEVAELAVGEGRIVKYEGKKMGLYKDETHQLHAIDPTCPHIHCNVAWNAAETSWDCPCHGARFSIDGELLTGPARSNLEKIDLDTIAGT